jgi:hypothetical protein
MAPTTAAPTRSAGRSPRTTVADSLDDLALQIDRARIATRGVAGDLSAIAAAATIDQRVDDLMNVHEALVELFADRHDPRCRALLQDASPLRRYLKELMAFSHTVAQVLRDAALGLCSLHVDWQSVRARLDGARRTGVGATERSVRLDLALLPVDWNDANDPLAGIVARAERVFATAARLDANLELPFG